MTAIRTEKILSVKYIDLHEPINSYFWWINPILYQHNVDILNIWMNSQGTEVAYHAKTHFFCTHEVYSQVFVYWYLYCNDCIAMRPELHFAEKCIFACHIGQVKQTVIAEKLWFSLIINFKRAFVVFKKLSHWICPFDYPQHMFWLRSNKIKF